MRDSTCCQRQCHSQNSLALEPGETNKNTVIGIATSKIKCIRHHSSHWADIASPRSAKPLRKQIAKPLRKHCFQVPNPVLKTLGGAPADSES